MGFVIRLSYPRNGLILASDHRAMRPYYSLRSDIPSLVNLLITNHGTRRILIPIKFNDSLSTCLL